MRDIREEFRVCLMSEDDFVHIPLNPMKQHACVIIALGNDADSPAGCEQQVLGYRCSYSRLFMMLRDPQLPCVGLLIR